MDALLCYIHSKSIILTLRPCSTNLSSVSLQKLFFLVSCLLCPFSAKIISQLLIPVSILHKMSMKKILNDKMAFTKLTLTTVVVIKICANPSSTTSYLLLFAFFIYN